MDQALADKRLLTDAIVRSLGTPASGNKITYDGGDPKKRVRGFGVRITAAGARAFVLNYRVDRRERRITIGSYPDWSVKAARDHAKGLKRRIDVGEDPMTEGPYRILDAVAELLQPRAHQLVIVAAQGVAGNIGDPAVRQGGFRIGRILGPVVHAHADAAHRPRQEVGGPAAFGPVTGHVVHLACEALAQPIQKVRLVAGEIDARDPEPRETEFRAPSAQVGQQGRRVECGSGSGSGVHGNKATWPMRIALPVL